MNELGKKIASEINSKGAISFARFMELALYCPVYGYYEREKDIIGKRGDFYTNVSVGPVFGELLAFQFAEWLRESKVQAPKSKVQLVEAGAHDGQLANDILNWLDKHAPDVFQTLEYTILEPSNRKQLWQKENLVAFQEHVHWVSDLAELAHTQPNGIRGVLFSNELLDAMPVHRFGWDANARSWFEWGVSVQEEKFIWARLPAESLPKNVPIIPAALEAVLPEQFTLENCPAAEQWWGQAANILACGYLLTIDYGRTADELLMPERPHATLRAYYQHHLNEDPLARPGEQDLTADVNFTAIQAIGEAHGLQTAALVSQEKFLTEIVGRAEITQPEFVRSLSQRSGQFLTLLHPEHFGRAFRVLVQSRAILHASL